MNGSLRSSFSEGQIVYAHFLHLDSIDPVRHCEPKYDEWGNYAHSIYTVQGKPRPLLVIGPNGEDRSGVQWYWVLKLTSSGGSSGKANRRGLVRLGCLLDGCTISYVERHPYSYPDNLFERTVKPLDRLDLLNILKIVGIDRGLP
jgi:hypothetical protein